MKILSTTAAIITLVSLPYSSHALTINTVANTDQPDSCKVLHYHMHKLSCTAPSEASTEIKCTCAPIHNPIWPAGMGPPLECTLGFNGDQQGSWTLMIQNLVYTYGPTTIEQPPVAGHGCSVRLTGNNTATVTVVPNVGTISDCMTRIAYNFKQAMAFTNLTVTRPTAATVTGNLACDLRGLPTNLICQ